MLVASKRELGKGKLLQSKHVVFVANFVHLGVEKEMRRVECWGRSAAVCTDEVDTSIATSIRITLVMRADQMVRIWATWLACVWEEVVVSLSFVGRHNWRNCVWTRYHINYFDIILAFVEVLHK
jgi:hypothetical protein